MFTKPHAVITLRLNAAFHTSTVTYFMQPSLAPTFLLAQDCASSWNTIKATNKTSLASARLKEWTVLNLLVAN
jgi:hypothetical protein